MSDKPIKAKPHFYSVCLAELQKIAKDAGYNLIVHGSLNRDMDLVCIPWINEPKTHSEVLKLFCEYLNVSFLTNTSDEPCHFSMLEGGRSSYIINLNRQCDYSKNEEDPQYYLDISFTPLVVDGFLKYNQ